MITFTEKFYVSRISISPINSDNKHPNLLANAAVMFKQEAGTAHFSFSGFTVWRSKINSGELNVEKPKNYSFKFFLSSEDFWKKIKAAIIEEYQRFEIPIIEEIEK